MRLNGRWDLTLPQHRQTQWTGGWEQKRLTAMHDTIRPGDVIVDVGAEEGDMSALYALWAGRFGGVVLVEPDPRVWSNIRATWEANPGIAPVLDWFVGFAAAATDLEPPEDDVTWLSEDWHGWPACSYDEIVTDHGFRHLDEQAAATPCITLDALITRRHVDYKMPRVDVVTIDVEGSELEVLKGACAVLDEARPVVFVSVHPAFMRDRWGQTPDDLRRFMLRHRYQGTLIEATHEEHWRYDP